MKNSFSFSKIIFPIGAIAMLVIYCALWLQTNAQINASSVTDFVAFFSAGRVAQQYGMRSVYNIAYQQAAQEQLFGFALADKQPLLFNHIPYLIPLLMFIAKQNYFRSLILWNLLQIALYGAGFHFLRFLLPADWRKSLRRNVMIGLGLFFPIFISIVIGQDSAFLFLGVSLFVYGALFERDFIAGAGLALTTVRPHLTLILALPVLFKNRKIFTYFLETGAILAVTSAAILGVQGTKDFVHILIISGKGNWRGMSESAMLNLIGILTRALASLSAENIRLIGWGFYILAIIALSIYWAKQQKITKKTISLSILASILFSPHLHYHDLGLLVIPILFILISPKLNARQDTLHLYALALSFALLLTLGAYTLYFLLPYLLYLLIAAFFMIDSLHYRQENAP